jgi:adenylate cyclase
MKTLRRIVVEEAVIGVVFLTAVWYAYYLVAVWGNLDYLEEGAFRSYVTSPAIHVEMLLSAMGLGILLALVNHLAEAPAIRRRPAGHIILLRSGMYLAGLAVLALIVNGVFLFSGLLSWGEMKALWDLLSHRLLVSLAFLMLASLLSLTFLLEVRRKVGPGNLWALLTGRYHRPRDERRVFLFLDLKGSTSIAERLGHSQYSQFIRNCFHDLTDFVLLHRAQIYQFAGDEVILTWPADLPHAGRRSVDTCFAFQSRLAQKRDWYQGSFGVAPEFRGGVEEGVVTATEVGDIKREIAFHGDALNTAARLLELCREYDRPLLVSERIQESIAGNPRFSTHLQEEVALRGRSKRISVFGVELAEGIVA